MDSQNDDRDHPAEPQPLEHGVGPEPPAAPAPAPARKKGKARVRHIIPPEQPDDSAVALTRKKGPGPKTPQAKARIRHNAMRFGIHTTDPVIPGERVEDWQAHRAGILASVEPANYLETLHAERMALVSWIQNRVTKYEVAEFTRANKGSQVFRLPPGNELDKIMKYDTHLTKQFQKAQDALEVRQKQRRGEATPLARLAISGQIER